MFLIIKEYYSRGTTINESQNRIVNADAHSYTFGIQNFYSLY